MADEQPIVCFGEMLLRLSAEGKEQGLIGSSAYAAHTAGAEANVAISLASLGKKARMVTILPDNALGNRVQKTLSDCDVDTGAILVRPGRMGLFFLNSQVAGREGGLLYDRAHSAFTIAEPAEIDWRAALSNASWLHISGVTAALGNKPLQALHLACDAAKRSGVKISFDCNYRPDLWRGREQEAPQILAALAQRANLLFAGPWDISLLTDVSQNEDFDGDGIDASTEAAFAAFPNLEVVAATSRTIVETGHHMLGAHIGRRSSIVHEAPCTINPIVDRIGSGDAFAAAVLYGLSQEWPDARIVRFALRACVMKHTIRGDYSYLGAHEIEAALCADPLSVSQIS